MYGVDDIAALDDGAEDIALDPMPIIETDKCMVDIEAVLPVDQDEPETGDEDMIWI